MPNKHIIDLQTVCKVFGFVYTIKEYSFDFYGGETYHPIVKDVLHFSSKEKRDAYFNENIKNEKNV